MATHRTQTNCICPICNERNTGATNAENTINDLPKEGDFSVCIYCGALAVFNTDLTLRILNEADKEWLKNNPETQQVLVGTQQSIFQSLRRNKR